MAKLRTALQPDIQGGAGNEDVGPLGDPGGQDPGLGAGGIGGPPIPQDKGQGSQSPRERVPGSGDITSAPRRPDTPSPMAGSAAQLPSTEGVIPFSPMAGGMNPGSPATPHLRGLYGSQGGLQGGGLGVPFEPAQSDPISSLIQLLMKQGGGQ